MPSPNPVPRTEAEKAQYRLYLLNLAQIGLVLVEFLKQRLLDHIADDDPILIISRCARNLDRATEAVIRALVMQNSLDKGERPAPRPKSPPPDLEHEPRELPERVERLPNLYPQDAAPTVIKIRRGLCLGQVEEIPTPNPPLNPAPQNQAIPEQTLYKTLDDLRPT